MSDRSFWATARTSDDTRILERGYRRYEGERRSPRWAVVSLARHSAQRALGLRRPLWAKVLPLVAAGIAFLPAVVFVGMAALIPEPLVDRDILLPTYAEYYSFVTSAIVIFTTFVGPEVICTDRRDGMLGLYLASPLTRDSYLFAKAGAILGVLAIATVGPPLLMLVAFTIEGNGPDGPDDFVVLLVRVLASGLAVSVAHTAISLAISSATDRRAFASAGIVLVLLVSGAVSGILTEGLDGPNWLGALNILAMPFELVQRIYGEHDPDNELSQISTAAVVAANILWTGAAALFVRTRYQRLTVDAVIRAERISKWFGDVVAVSDVSFVVGPGVTALLGPNGAGKSTVLRMIAGLTTPSQGELRVLDRNPRTDIELFRWVGLVPQQEALFAGLTALEFVRLAAVLEGVERPDEAALGALAAVEMPAGDPRPLRTYSKGMRQRVKVAQALVHGPQVLLLDEPLTGLDPRQRLNLIRLFQRLGDEGRCVLVSSHVLDEVERLGSRVLVMAQGRLAAEGDFRAIRDLMDDRPHRLQVRTDRPEQLAAGLVAGGAAVGVRLGDGGVVLVDTVDAVAFRRSVPVVAREHGARLYEVVPLDDDLDSVFRYLVGR